MTTCSNCARDWPEDRFNLSSLSPTICFRCRASSLNVGFAGGKQYFHDDTDKRRQDRAVSEAAANGYEAVPVRTTGLGAGTGASMEKLGVHLRTQGAFGGKAIQSQTNQVVTANG